MLQGKAVSFPFPPEQKGANSRKHHAAGDADSRRVRRTLEHIKKQLGRQIQQIAPGQHPDIIHSAGLLFLVLH